MSAEQVLVFPGELAPNVDGYIPFDEGLFDLLIGKSSFIGRAEAEESPFYKQLIPYIVMFDERGRVFSYQRSSKQKEARLRALFSVGIGGHINPIDGVTDNASVFFNAALREIEEEIGIKLKKSDLDILCFVNDNSNSVGRVHFGVCLGFDCGNRDLNLEDTISRGGFMDIERCMADLDSYETWSRFLLEFISRERK